MQQSSSDDVNLHLHIASLVEGNLNQVQGNLNHVQGTLVEGGRVGQIFGNIHHHSSGSSNVPSFSEYDAIDPNGSPHLPPTEYVVRTPLRTPIITSYIDHSPLTSRAHLRQPAAASSKPRLLNQAIIPLQFVSSSSPFP